LILDCRF